MVSDRWGGANEYRDEGTSNQCDWRRRTHIWENLEDLILTVLFWQLILLFRGFFFPSGLNLNHWGHSCLDAVQFSFTYWARMRHALCTYASCTVLDAWGEGRLLQTTFWYHLRWISGWTLRIWQKANGRAKGGQYEGRLGLRAQVESASFPLVLATACCTKWDTLSRLQRKTFLGDLQGLRWGHRLYKLVLEGSVLDPDEG